MVKKILLLSTLLLINVSYSSERAKSPKPYATLGAFLNTSSSKPITMDEVIRQTKALQNTHYSDISDEIKRYEQLEKNYEIFCANLKTRGLKEKHDSCKAYAQNCRNKIEELLRIEQELKQLDDDIYNILNDDSLGAKPYRWVAARPLYVRTVQISPKDSEQHKEAQSTLEFIDNKKQPIVDQLNFIKKLELDGNIAGMVKAYESLLLLSPESQVDIHARITELKKRIAKESALFDVTHSIDTIMSEETSTTARYEKVVDYCQRTLASNSDTAVQETCKTQRLKYKKLLAFKEMIAAPIINDNEFVYTTYRSRINEADSVGINDIRRSIKSEVEFSNDLPQLDGYCAAITDHDYEQDEDTTTTVSRTNLKDAGKLVKRDIGLEIINLEDTLHKMIRKEDEKVTQALAKVNTHNKAEHLVELANAYHARAEFYQKYYPETQKTKIDRNRYDARNTGLQVYNKNKQIREQLNFAL